MRWFLLFLLLLAFLPPNVEAACSGDCVGTVCDFTSSNCGSEVSGCVNECGGTCTCSNVNVGGGSTLCDQMGCDYHAAGNCEGTPDACSTHSTSGDCTTAGCSWTVAICQGPIPCPSYDSSTCASEPDCWWQDSTCTGTPDACSTHNSQSSDCTTSGCTYYASNTCDGSCSSSCSSYYYQGDSTCATCTDRGCSSYGTQCTQRYSTCGTQPTACSSRSCASCPVGGCLKDDGCSCTLNTQCDGGYCAWDESLDTVCYDSSSGCLKDDCSYVTSGYSSTTCYSAGGSGTPGERYECDTDFLGDYVWGQETGNCGYQSNECDAEKCTVQREADACSSGSCATGGAGYDSVSGCGANKVCYNGGCQDASSSLNACDGDTNYYASLGDCTAARRYSECSSGNVCDDDADTNYQTGTAYPISVNKVANTMSGSTSVSETDATSTSSSCDDSVDYWSTYGDCTYTQRYAECNGAGSCDGDASNNYQLSATNDVPSGYVGETQSGGTDSTPYQAGDCSFYCSLDTSDRCSAPSSPETGFGDRERDAFACNGGGSCSNDVADCTIDCGTGCCYDAGATTTCAASGSTSYDFWDFGTGDTSANDYCLSTRVYDCSSTSQCEAGSYSCTYNSCITSDGHFIVEDSSANDMMLIDKEGKILLRGSLYENNAVTPGGGNDFIIDNGAGTERAYVDGSTGNLYLDGTLYENQGSLSPSGDNDFIIQDSGGTTRAYVEGSNGNLYTQSVIIENVIS